MSEQPALAALAKSARVMAADALSRWENERQASGARPVTPEDTRAYGESAIWSAVSALNRAELSNGRRSLTPDEEETIAATVRSRMFGQGSLDSILSDPRVENVVANGCDNVWITGSRFVWTSEAGPIPIRGPVGSPPGETHPDRREGPRMLEHKPGPLDGHGCSRQRGWVSFRDSPVEGSVAGVRLPAWVDDRNRRCG